MKISSLYLKSTILISALSTVACGRAISHRVQSATSLRTIPSSNTLSLATSVEDYQIGPEWGKTPVNADILAKETTAFQRAAKATARVRIGFGGATAFVIGEKNGEILMATNHHVIEDNDSCPGASISFELLGINNLRCRSVVYTDTDLDLTIFTLAYPTEAQKTSLRSVMRTFSKAEPKKGELLLTIGYGIAGNPRQKSLMSEQDSDCKTYSPDGESRFMADPDEVNPGPYKTWMFANGCDVSHGDSGSAIVDRKTGDVVGILSTGKIPKHAFVRDANYLAKIFSTNTEEVWKELTFAVPSSKIWEIASTYLPDSMD